MLSPHAAEIEYLCTWEVWCSTDLSRQNRALLIGGTLLIPLKSYRACWKELKSSTGIYFSSKLCMQNSHKKGGSMNLSCPELALHLLADLLWLRHMAHELPHPCPPPSSSSQGRKNDNGKLSAANLLSVSFELFDPLAGAQWPSSTWLAPAHSLAQTSHAGTPTSVLGSLWQPQLGP